MMAAPCPLLGDGITDDTLLHISRFLPTARDLLCLKLTNSRFAAKASSPCRPAAQPGRVQRQQRRRWCASRTRRGGCGWRVAASRSAGGYLVAISRACWVWNKKLQGCGCR